MITQYCLPATPAVSIGMPVCNGEWYVSEALDSLIAQTFADFELIISDNASTDGTEDICRSYANKDARVRYFRQNKNRGPENNFRFVLDQASGPYFMWAAHDDFWSPNFISECISALKKTPNCHFAVTKFRVISRLSPILSRYFMPDLGLVTSDDPKERVLSFSKMSFVEAHKDNLVYALWDRKAIVKVLSDLKSHVDGGIFVGEYALSIYRGAFVDKVLLFKKYPHLVGGHPLNPIVWLILRLMSILHKRRFQERFRYFRPNNEQRERIEVMQREILVIKNVVAALRLAKCEESFIVAVVNAHRSWLNEESVERACTEMVIG